MREAVVVAPRWLLDMGSAATAFVMAAAVGSSWLELNMPGVYETIADTDDEEGSWCCPPMLLPPPIGLDPLAFTDTLVMCGGPGLCRGW